MSKKYNIILANSPWEYVGNKLNVRTGREKYKTVEINLTAKDVQ